VNEAIAPLELVPSAMEEIASNIVGQGDRFTVPLIKRCYTKYRSDTMPRKVRVKSGTEISDM
jgi:hypothetical protein